MEDRSRRVVTGVDESGRSTIILDGPLLRSGALGVVWRTASVPSDNSASTDCDNAGSVIEGVEAGGSTFAICDVPPFAQPYWHATNTIDYGIVLDGELVLETEAADTVLLAGDAVVLRGVKHNWRNAGSVPARVAFVMIPAKPA